MPTAETEKKKMGGGRFALMEVVTQRWANFWPDSEWVTHTLQKAEIQFCSISKRLVKRPKKCTAIFFLLVSFLPCLLTGLKSLPSCVRLSACCHLIWRLALLHLLPLQRGVGTTCGPPITHCRLARSIFQPGKPCSLISSLTLTIVK